MLDILFRRYIASEIGQLPRLLKCKPDAPGAPLLGEKLLAVMLDELQGRSAQNQIFPRQSDKQRAAGLRLYFPRLAHAVRIKINESNRGFRAVVVGVAGRNQNHLSFASIKIDMVPGSGRTENAGQVFLTNDAQRAAQSEERGLAGKIGITTRARLEKRRPRL